MNHAAVRARRPSGLLGLVFRALVLVNLIGAVALWRGHMHLGWLAASLLFLVLVIALGVVWPGSGVFARPILGVTTPYPELALTFDDGPDPEGTRAVMDLLEAGGHRATFFAIGENLRRHPELAAEIVKRGHSLANHSLLHSPVTNLRSPRKLATELKDTGALITKAGGRPSPFFRPPVGLLSPRIARAAHLGKLNLVAWTASARDGVAARTVEEGMARLAPALNPGAILVLHDGARDEGRVPIAPRLLELLVPRLSALGLQSVTLERLLRL